jgi:hypothetical protein
MFSEDNYVIRYIFWLLLFLFPLAARADDVDILARNFLAARTERCWTQDRMSNKNVVSVSATGLGFYAYVIAAERSIIQNTEASKWIKRGFEETMRININNKGWLYHFTDLDGRPVMNKSVSSIDTAIFYVAAEKAAARLKDKELITLIKKAKDRINVDFMYDNSLNKFRHAFIWNNNMVEFNSFFWDDYNEGIILYKYFDKPFKPDHTLYTLPLFVYFYPLAFYDDKEIVSHLGKAIDYQIDHIGTVGFTATDGPAGYQIMKPDIVSPLAVNICSKFFPEKVKKTLSEYKVGSLTQATTLDGRWKSKDRILIDDGFALLIATK